jgi:hypothetical protein
MLLAEMLLIVYGLLLAEQKNTTLFTANIRISRRIYITFMAAALVSRNPPVIAKTPPVLPGDRFVTADKPGQPPLFGNAGSGQYGRMIFPISTRRDADVFVQGLRRYDEALEVPNRSERSIKQTRPQATTRQEPAYQFWEAGLRRMAERREDRESWQYTPFNAPLMVDGRGGQRQYTASTQRANSVDITLPAQPSTQAYINREQMRWHRKETRGLDFFDNPTDRMAVHARHKVDFGSINFRHRMDVNDQTDWADANQLSRKAADPRAYRTTSG